MSQTVIGIFDYGVDAQRAAQELMSKGFAHENVDITIRGAVDRTAGTADTDYDRRDSDSGGIGGFFSSLFDSDEDTDRYTRVAERSSIVTVHARSEEEAERAADILDEYGAVDVEERAAQYGSTTGTAGIAGAATTAATTQTGDSSISVIEEEMNVGKRTVETGGVRLRSRIIERPVQESLRLREEHVHVERRPVNRPATESDFANFKEGEIEITEHAEVPVVEKEARVVEEISLDTDVEEREETIRGTVRKTDVDVEEFRADDETRRRTDDTTRTGNI